MKCGRYSRENGGASSQPTGSDNLEVNSSKYVPCANKSGLWMTGCLTTWLVNGHAIIISLSEHRLYQYRNSSSFYTVKGAVCNSLHVLSFFKMFLNHFLLPMSERIVIYVDGAATMLA